MNQQFAEKSWFNIRLESREVCQERTDKTKMGEKADRNTNMETTLKKRVNREIKSAHGLFDGKRMHADTSQ